MVLKKMGDEAQAALEDSQGVYADDLQKQKEIKKQINEMRGKQENLKKKSMELQGTIQEMEEKYAEAQRREEKAEKNAMILSIVNICTSTLTLGLNAYSEKAKAQGTQQNQQVAQTETQQQESQSNLQREPGMIIISGKRSETLQTMSVPRMKRRWMKSWGMPERKLTDSQTVP